METNHPPITQERIVHGANWHIGPLIGCATVWFETPEAAREVYRRLGRIPSGREARQCKLCKSNYKGETPEHKRAPMQYACERYKIEIAGCPQK